MAHAMEPRLCRTSRRATRRAAASAHLHSASKMAAVRRVRLVRARCSTSPEKGTLVQQNTYNEPSFAVHVVTSINQVAATEWDGLAVDASGGRVDPFISHAFLSALESSGSASGEEGWGPSHMLLYLTPSTPRQQHQDGKSEQAQAHVEPRGRLVGAVPLYVKRHSYGEYVFDSSWARAASMMGVSYYPKLQSCVPFSPVTGARLLAAQGLAPWVQRTDVLRALGMGLIELADALGVSSVHVTFNTEDDAAALEALGFCTRVGLQFHWENSRQPAVDQAPANGKDDAGTAPQRYTSFEDFLSCLKQSKRKSIRQERKSVRAQGLRIRRLSGDQLRAEGPALWDTFYRYYQHTVDRKWGTAYLKPAFFHQLGATMADRVLLVVAEERLGAEEPGAGGQHGSGSSCSAPKWRMVAASLNLLGSHTLYGRNWAACPDKQFKHLHFEACYYAALEEAIERGLERVEAGAQGEHKLQRGYLPSLTYSSHWLRSPALRTAVERFTARETAEVIWALQALTVQSSPYSRGFTANALVSKLAAMQRSPVGSVSGTYDALSSAEDEVYRPNMP